MSLITDNIENKMILFNAMLLDRDYIFDSIWIKFSGTLFCFDFNCLCQIEIESVITQQRDVLLK
jgi:hypothetical protein